MQLPLQVALVSPAEAPYLPAGHGVQLAEPAVLYLVHSSSSRGDGGRQGGGANDGIARTHRGTRNCTHCTSHIAHRTSHIAHRTSHIAQPACTHLPAGHCPVHEAMVPPAASPYRPAGHAVQLDAFEAAEYRPGAHRAHGAEPPTPDLHREWQRQGHAKRCPQTSCQERQLQTACLKGTPARMRCVRSQYRQTTQPHKAHTTHNNTQPTGTTHNSPHTANRPHNTPQHTTAAHSQPTTA